MREFIFEAEQVVNASLATVFDFFSKAENLEKLTPSFLNFNILTPLPFEIKKGTLIDYKIRFHGVPMKWKTLIDEWNPGQSFVDTQLRGPFKLWHHRHTFEARGAKTMMRDRVRYALPLAPLTNIAHPLFVRPDIEKIFIFRRKVIDEIFKP